MQLTIIFGVVNNRFICKKLIPFDTQGKNKIHNVELHGKIFPGKNQTSKFGMAEQNGKSIDFLISVRKDRWEMEKKG
jgi:hypothetical protein